MFEQFEDEAMTKGYRFVVGCDEAGRGPLAGPVVGAACYLPKGILIRGLNDSKKLSKKQRETLYREIIGRDEIKYGINIVSAKEIDKINILQASLKAMKKAVDEIDGNVDFILLDGNRVFNTKISCQAVVRGDSRVASIAAASIIAKVTRDKIMEELAEKHPEYGFAQHKGYPTKKHLAALKRFGPISEHRMTFGPLKVLQKIDTR